ncbi:phosphogluconate dehydrogenase (decarboxylating) gnd1 [Binucleata daphniae]
MDLALVGLGVMGQNLALNITKTHKLAIYNRTADKTNEICQKIQMIKPGYAKACYTMEDLVHNIKSPKIILVLVQSGEAVDNVVHQLLSLVTKNDVIVDLGNSHYKDTIRRCEEYKNKFLFVGCGISGGEYGARHGPSIMPGGDERAWNVIKDVLQTIAAKKDNYVCCDWIGDDGAGHFVKMVHNGIEYGNMAIISEVCDIMKRMGLSNNDIAKTYTDWNVNEKNYLYEITSKIFSKKADGEYVIDHIDDKAENKGTGIWSVMAAMESQYQSKIMSDAIYERIISSEQEKRRNFSKKIVSPECKLTINLTELKQAMDMCVLLSYIQGMSLIKVVSRKHGWKVNSEAICNVWQNGCIIRSQTLDTLKEIIKEKDYENSEIFINICQQNINSLRKTVVDCVINAIPALVMNGCLNYLDALMQEKGTGNIIQALRDYFGAHKVLTSGEKEYKHIEWESD